MNILVIGSGGREHAFAWKLKQSKRCDHLYVAPGNGGTAEIATNLNIDVNDIVKVKSALITRSIDLLIIGPEEPLVNGLVDQLKEDNQFKNLLIVGPSGRGAALEGSKEFSKGFMNKYGIPTARAQTFDASTLEQGYEFLETLEAPYVLKADGLAAGKGVIITENLQEAKEALSSLIVDKKFGKASERVLVEEYLSGIEVSVFVLTDGKNYKILPEAKDYKRIGEGDTGPNTGGMGAISPVIFADKYFMEKVEEQIIKPTIEGLGKEGIDYCGFIFIGLMNKAGNPHVIEYNVRMGDPETEVVLPRINTDLVDLMEAAATGSLAELTLEIAPFTASTVVLVSGGYPGSYKKGNLISFTSPVKEAILFHAGTTLTEEGLLTSGGRVMAVTCLGKNMGEALDKCYKACEKVAWEGKTFRKDIGFDLRELRQ